MKRFLSLVILASMLACLVACGGTSDPADTTGPDTTDPVTETTAEPEPVIPELGYEHVVILGVDGAGAFFNQTDTPRMDEIFANGACTYNCITASPTISAQCWGAMLLGVTPEIHGLTNGLIAEKRRFSDDTMPSIFRLVREAYPDAKLGAICNWSPIFHGIIESDLGVDTYSENDFIVADYAIQYFKENLPTLMFLQFDSVDGAGHNFGYGTTQHLRQITKIDELIGNIYDAIVESGKLDSTLILVVADHGGSGTDHGGETPEEKNVFLGAVGGKSVIAGGEILDAETRDVAAIALTALGLPIYENMSSRVPTGLFEGITAGERNISKETRKLAERRHDNVPTPEAAELQALTPDREILAYLPFDGDETVKIGGAEAVTNGKIYYSEGYFGEGASFDDGFMTLSGVSVGTESYSVSFWLKIAGIEKEVAIFNNDDWSNGMHPGFVIGATDTDIFYTVSNRGKGRIDLSAGYPATAVGGWMHVILTVDREKQTADLYMDFANMKSCSIESQEDSSFDTDYAFMIGQDKSGTAERSLTAMVDEMVIYKGALTPEEIESLHGYYGTAEEVPLA